MNDEQIEKLLVALDSIASDYDCELGLAIGDVSAAYDGGAHNEQLRQTVRDWLCELSGIYEVGENWERAIILPSIWEIE